MRRVLIIAAFAVSAALLAAGAAAAWIVFGPNTPPFSEQRAVRIPPGSGIGAVADSLESSGVLRWGASFRLFARVTGWGSQVKAGHYLFDAGLSNHDILGKLRRGIQEPVHLTVPPGTRPEVLAAVAGRDLFFDRDALDSVLSDPDLAASLDSDTTILFGCMLPETYYFYWLTSPENTIRKIKEQFDTFYRQELEQRADSLGLSKRDVVTLASLIEWETSHPEEKSAVSGVYHNRLRIGMKLDADPTIQYIVMQQEGQKRRLLYEDYRIPHPFNTYLNGGLPPGPLNNPSPSSLRAAVNPDDHQFLFFVATGDGTHHFSRTLAEHNRAARRYHDLMQERRATQEGTTD